MTPLEQIEDGIKTGNWLTVCEGYRCLTGKDMFDSNVHQTNAYCTTLLQIIHSIHAMSSVEGSNADSIHKSKTLDLIRFDEVENPPSNNSCKTKFGNEGRLIGTECDENEVKKNLAKAERASSRKRPRAKPQMVKATCNECGKEFESGIRSGELGQKCPTCLNKSIKDCHG